MKNFISIILFASILIALYYFLKPSEPERKLISSDIKEEVYEEDGASINTIIDAYTENNEQKIVISQDPKQNLKQKVPATEAFTNTDTGKNLSKLMELIRKLENPTSSKGKEAWNKLNILKENPKETFAEIKSALIKINDQDETKKQFLIQFASRLDVNKEKRLNMLSEELEQAIINTQMSQNIQTQMTPSIIFETYVKLVDDETKAEELLLKVLPKSTSQIQRTLLASYNKVNPQRTDELIKEFNLNN
jgi:hypothetical protein